MNKLTLSDKPLSTGPPLECLKLNKPSGDLI